MSMQYRTSAVTPIVSETFEKVISSTLIKRLIFTQAISVRVTVAKYFITRVSGVHE